MTNEPDIPRRRGQRFIFDRPVSGGYGAAPVAVLNIGPRGLQLEHSEPIRLRMASRISIPLPNRDEQAQLKGEVVWSRLSIMPDAEGKFVYRSGVKLEETPENILSVQRVVAAYQPRFDPGAPERKGQRQAPKTVTVRPLKLPSKKLDPDRVLLIRQVRERLRQNPEDRRTLAVRARSALADRVASIVNTDEELAIWEYLQHVVSLDDIRDALS